jgi:hypothetical protein
MGSALSIRREYQEGHLLIVASYRGHCMEEALSDLADVEMSEEIPGWKMERVEVTRRSGKGKRPGVFVSWACSDKRIADEDALFAIIKGLAPAG